MKELSNLKELSDLNWRRDLFAHVRSIVNTDKRQGLFAFEAILVVLNHLESLFPLG
jgi:hypothetical protein